MSTLSSEAYLEQLEQQVVDNLPYRSANSLTKCRLLIEAIEGLILMRPSEARSGGTAGETFRFDMQTLLQLKRDAEKWLSGRNIAASQTTYIEYCNE